MKINIEHIGKQIQKFFNEQVEMVALKTKFVQRKPKLTGTKFLQAIVFSNLENKEMTLSSLAQSCLDVGVEITEQGIDKRLDSQSVAFMKEMASKALETFREQGPIAIELLQQFEAVYLLDSSQFSVPETMAKLFPGAGGNASSAAIKMQLVFDYLHGHIEQTELLSGRDADQGYRGHWSLIKAGTLFIMDLGYYVLDTFKTINDEGGFFVSRFQAQTAIYNPSGQRLEIKELLSEQSELRAEYDILLGARSQHQIPCRLIAIRLSQEAAERQRQKAKENAQRHGRTVTKEWLQLLDWALFITNIPSPMLKTEHVASLYRIRWQVELIFKMCKSFCGLNYVTSLRPERILTEFYARLIAVALTYFLVQPLRLPFATDLRREISPIKVRKTFKRFARELATAINDLTTFTFHLHDFFQHVLRFGFKQNRVSSPNAAFALALVSACYDWTTDDIPDGMLSAP